MLERKRRQISAIKLQTCLELMKATVTRSESYFYFFHIWLFIKRHFFSISIAKNDQAWEGRPVFLFLIILTVGLLLRSIVTEHKSLRATNQHKHSTRILSLIDTPAELSAMINYRSFKTENLDQACVTLVAFWNFNLYLWRGRIKNRLVFLATACGTAARDKFTSFSGGAESQKLDKRLEHKARRKMSIIIMSMMMTATLYRKRKWKQNKLRAFEEKNIVRTFVQLCAWSLTNRFVELGRWFSVSSTEFEWIRVYENTSEALKYFSRPQSSRVLMSVN